MDERIKGMMEALEKEQEAVEAGSSGGGKSTLYRLLPFEDKAKFDNRFITLLWRPAKICAEIFGEFYDEETWDFKAAVRVHYIESSEGGEERKVCVFCQPGTAEYYEKYLERKFEKRVCPHCDDGDKWGTRYVFQVFDYQKLIGERDLDEGEDRPSIQALIGPQAIYNGLWSKMKVGIEFWDDKISGAQDMFFRFLTIKNL
jgi:hypothetical protein